MKTRPTTAFSSFPLTGKDKGRGDNSDGSRAPLSRPLRLRSGHAFPVRGKESRLRCSDMPPFLFYVGERKLMNLFVEICCCWARYCLVITSQAENSQLRSASRLRWRSFHNRLHARQTLLELPADHLVHVHKQVDHLGHEVFFAEHTPRHCGLIALRLEGELRGVGGRERLEEFEFDSDHLAWTTLNDCHASFANLIVADPRVNGAASCRRAFVRLFHRRIDFAPRVPCFPFVEIIHLGKYRRRRSGNSSAPGDTELRWLHGNDYDEDEHDHRE